MRFALRLSLAILCFGIVHRFSNANALPAPSRVVGSSSADLKDVESINGLKTDDDIQPVPAKAARLWAIFPIDRSSLCGLGYRRDTRGRCRPVFFYNESEQTSD